MNTLRFSDYDWIDISCYLTFLLLLIPASLVALIEIQFNLFDMFPKSSYSSILIAPIVEESFKFLMLSIDIQVGIAFTGVFACLESLRFMQMAINKTGGLPVLFVILRIICIGVHFLTLACQIFGLKMYYKYDSWAVLLLGYVAAIFIHLEWNVEVGRVVLIGLSHVYYLSEKLLGI